MGMIQRFRSTKIHLQSSRPHKACQQTTVDGGSSQKAHSVRCLLASISSEDQP
ncbi:hypothetical protein POX_a00663 [Penicillium oxalicum]|uniref:hypothetical protein n=1 Tax=Penicillium oxalicum TaxID=69781 RepID=UPI0020B70105|nr:hypothetical protein POX_a00663 [Penicillium oxalicum]KAI2794073.1 hypothetical protein POX_a00663 [Penicillium oxalicum]